MLRHLILVALYCSLILSCIALQAAAQQALEELGIVRSEAQDMQACLQHSQVHPHCPIVADCPHALGCDAIMSPRTT